MNSALAGLFKGIQGGSAKYGEIKRDQRRYELDDKKAAQADMRKKNFAQYNYTNFTDSGLRDKQGRKMTPGQVDALPEDELSALESQEDRNVRIKEESRQSALTAKEGKAAALLQEKDAKTAQLLTEADAKRAALLKTKNEREDAKAATKKTEDEVKAKTKVEKDFVTASNKDINTKIKDSDFDGVTASTDAAMSFYAENRDNPMVAMIPKVKAASVIYKNSIKFQEAFNSASSYTDKGKIEDAKEAMKADGMSKIDMERVVKYLTDKGRLDT